jgi:ABC-2 type transport system ATP-binding protein
MNHVISAKGLEMHFPGCDALQGVDLNVKQGTVFALLGENGAGKTTLIRILMGYQKASAGSCSVLGLDPVRDELEIRRRVGYVSDAPALYDWMQVGEIGWFASAFYPDGFMDRYREAIERYELPQSRKIKHLSKGQRAKVALALALAHDPELLILDEPTSGLDPLVRREFLESMIERAATGRTVFLSSHQIAEVERVADEIAVLHAGKFRIVDSLSELRDSVHKITISLSDPLITLPQIDGPTELLSEETEGRQRRFVVRGDAQQVLKLWEGRTGVQQIQARPATLDELFVACTRGIPIKLESKGKQSTGDTATGDTATGDTATGDTTTERQAS